uniref:TIR domain-containing protein n=1 Tax=Pygocentrus nattereri TaxID=42514 RepID=A0A3B4BZX4_PYGNA
YTVCVGHPLVLHQWSQGTVGWIFLVGGLFSVQQMDYSLRILTASCLDVTDLKLDLAVIPLQINTLCLKAARGLEIHSNALSRFMVLEELHIRGCPEVVHARAFMGLPNLWLLSLQSEKCCSSSIPSNAFGHALRELYLDYYNVSAIAIDAFNALSGLRALEIFGCASEFPEISCRIAKVSTSLISLKLEAEEIVILRNRSCGFLDDALLAASKTLKNVTFSFPNLRFLDKGALKYFPKIWALKMPMNNNLKTQLLQSGVRELARLETERVNISTVCEIVLGLSIEHLDLRLNSHFKLKSDTELNGCLGLKKLRLAGSSKLVDLSFIHFFKNLTVSEFEHIPLQSLDSLCETSDPVKSLQMFYLSYADHLKITRRCFFCLKSLSTLILPKNGISVIEDFAFEGLENLDNLRHLDLLGNRISSLNFAVFKGLSRLKFLSLNDNKIAQITANHSIPPLSLESLEQLDLKNNGISYIDDFAFKQLKSLKILNLEHNNISEIKTFTFSGLDRLESLMLDYNVLKHIEASSFTKLASLQNFSIGCLMQASTKTSKVQINLGFIFGTFPSNLTHLYISSCSRPMNIVIGSNSAPRPGLTLQVYGKEVSLEECERPFFQSVVGLNIMTQQFLCGSQFPGKYFKYLDNISFQPQVMSSFVDLVDLNTLLHLKKIYFQNTDFSVQPHLKTMFHNLTKLEHLQFYECRIPSLNEDVTRDLKSLKIFTLIGAYEFSLLENFPRPLVNLQLLFLSNVVLRCSCDNAWFNEWAELQKQIQVAMIMTYEKTGYACKDANGLHSFKRFAQANCFVDMEFVLFASTSLGIFFFMLMILLHNLAGDYLLAFIYIARGWVEEAMRGNTRGCYQFDAFVSYCGKDESWVVDDLLPNLDKRGPPFLRLCLHSRDFQLGLDIVENITDSLYKSRRTLCLVSHHYLRSKWCLLEMSLATHRLLAEQRDILILVFLEKIPARHLSAHHRLARLVKTRTYIDWPKDLPKQAIFWDRLWAKLQHGQEAAPT